ncbi:MAG: hypothetical protein IBX52_04645 [Bacterioplanes sp.]|nr:hypothetical protein [Bacterioplanes sp.]
MIFSKIFITFLTVYLLSVVAQRLGPRHAGVLAGFPLGSAIVLYFFALEQGVEFAATSARYTLSGLAAALALAYCYAQASLRWHSRIWLPWVVLLSLLAFFALGIMLQSLPPWYPLHMAIIAVAIVIGHVALRSIPEQTQPVVNNHAITRWLRQPIIALIARATLASASVLFITAAAHVLDAQWSGVLAAFPVSFVPLLILLHASYGSHTVAATIKHYPLGLIALALYALAVSLFYPWLGLNWGTVAALSVSIIYLMMYAAVRSRHVQKLLQ